MACAAITLQGSHSNVSENDTNALRLAAEKYTKTAWITLLQVALCLLFVSQIKLNGGLQNG